MFYLFVMIDIKTEIKTYSYKNYTNFVAQMYQKMM